MFKNYFNSIARMKAMIAIMLVLTGGLAPMVHAQGTYTVQIENATRYSINAVHLSSVTNRWWGPDLLGADTLYPGYVFTTHLYSGQYDLKLVDEDGDVCIVPNVSVSGPTSWRITNSWLLNCERHN